ncbi:nuclear transport factor 2 family protein [Lentzea alba]|uniref:nuclear transport factor 2 family protein n=1 Tax=Lentzea alba TaxID=2714351 RepID=UPI0039BEF826
METLRNYFTLLAALDIDEWSRLWSEDCVQVMPFAVGSLPGEVRGRDAVRDLYDGMARQYRTLRFDDLTLYPATDPDQVLALWKPRGELTDGTEYSNENIAMFEFGADGLIARFTEYFNPAGVGDRFVPKETS